MRLRSTDPASGELVWEGSSATGEECRAALDHAREALRTWSRISLDDRIAVAQRFADLVREEIDDVAELIARETGKLLWDARGEVGAMIGKVAISIAAQAERAGYREESTAFGKSVLRHRPHGIMAVLGPYNFPGHLPNGHIVPALLAGNCVIFKPSEETPAVGERYHAMWRRAGLPEAVLQIVQGDRVVGAALIDSDIDGVLFTGSATAGRAIRRALIDRPNVIAALELGGSNPLVAWDGDPDVVATLVAQSAFVTTGQRCSCARRLIVPASPHGDAIVDAVQALAGRLPIGAWDDASEAFMGPLISDRAAIAARARIEELTTRGARPLLASRRANDRSAAFLTPALFDATDIELPDAEIFAPVLQIIRVANFDAAINRANATAFGLSAGLISSDVKLWERFREDIRSGIINWNRPTTGASSNMPFGGIGESGNHRASAYYAADYCAFPTASFEAPDIAAVDIAGCAPAARSG